MKYKIIRVREDIIGIYEGTEKDAEQNIMDNLNEEPDANWSWELIK